MLRANPSLLSLGTDELQKSVERVEDKIGKGSPVVRFLFDVGKAGLCVGTPHCCPPPPPNLMRSRDPISLITAARLVLADGARTHHS